jgi:hypothetical protein
LEAASLFTSAVGLVARALDRVLHDGRFRLLRYNGDVIWPDYVAAEFGLERAQGRGALLGIGDGPLETRLDLIQWLEPLATFPDPARLATTAPRIIAIRVENVRAAYEDLRGAGSRSSRRRAGPTRRPGSRRSCAAAIPTTRSSS